MRTWLYCVLNVVFLNSLLPVWMIFAQTMNMRCALLTRRKLQTWDTFKLVLSYSISHLFVEVDCGVETVVLHGCFVGRVLNMQQNKANVLCAGLLIQGKQDIRC